VRAPELKRIRLKLARRARDGLPALLRVLSLGRLRQARARRQRLLDSRAVLRLARLLLASAVLLAAVSVAVRVRAQESCKRRWSARVALRLPAQLRSYWMLALHSSRSLARLALSVSSLLLAQFGLARSLPWEEQPLIASWWFAAEAGSAQLV